MLYCVLCILVIHITTTLLMRLYLYERVLVCDIRDMGSSASSFFYGLFFAATVIYIFVALRKLKICLLDSCTEHCKTSFFYHNNKKTPRDGALCLVGETTIMLTG